MTAVWFAVTDGAEKSPPVLIVPRFVLQVAWEVTLVVDPLLQVAVAEYCAVEPSFTDAAPVIAMLLKVTGAALTVRLTARVVFPVPFVVLAKVTVSL